MQTIEIIGLVNVDGEKLVLNIFLYKKLIISKTGHIIINTQRIFSMLNFFIFSIYILLNIKQ